MVAINPEMLRELLDEFTEKEEVTREEMNAINQQIAELEKRIESSKVKLAGLNRDREKIDLMRERYLSGNWKLQLSNMASISAESAAATTSTAAPAQSTPAPTATVSALEPAAAAASAPATSSHAEGRAARRAAREAASQSDSKATITNLEAVSAPVSLSASAPVAPPENAPAMVEVEVAAAPEPVVASQPEPVFEAPSEPEDYGAVQPEPTFEPMEEYAQAESIEHAPPDDPIMSSFNSAPAVAPDVASALASGAQLAEPAAAETDSGFSWSSTAINAVPEQAAAAPTAQPNPWGSSGGAPVEAEQRQTPSDIWGHPAQPAQAPPAFAQAPAPVAETGAWGYSEDQRATAPNIPSTPTAMPSAPPVPAPSPAEGAWGQPASNPWGNPASAQPVDLPPAGGGWGQPTASRQGMPAMPAPTSFPVAAPAPAADNSSNPGDAWGRGQASAGWASQGSPWGDPQAQAPAPAPANPFSQSQSQAPAQMPAPSAEDESARSSLARAADGALISPVKGRRRGAGAPAAFDWGSPEGSPPANPSDPNQAGGSEDSGDNKKIDDVLKGLFK